MRRKAGPRMWWFVAWDGSWLGPVAVGQLRLALWTRSFPITVVMFSVATGRFLWLPSHGGLQSPSASEHPWPRALYVVHAFSVAFDLCRLGLYWPSRRSASSMYVHGHRLVFKGRRVSLSSSGLPGSKKLRIPIDDSGQVRRLETESIASSTVDLDTTSPHLVTHPPPEPLVR
jgi:hypothetical protein